MQPYMVLPEIPHLAEVISFTGLPVAGKTSLANALVPRLQEHGFTVYRDDAGEIHRAASRGEATHLVQYLQETHNGQAIELDQVADAMTHDYLQRIIGYRAFVEMYPTVAPTILLYTNRLMPIFAREYQLPRDGFLSVAVRCAESIRLDRLMKSKGLDPHNLEQRRELARDMFARYKADGERLKSLYHFTSWWGLFGSEYNNVIVDSGRMTIDEECHTVIQEMGVRGMLGNLQSSPDWYGQYGTAYSQA